MFGEMLSYCVGGHWSGPINYDDSSNYSVLIGQRCLHDQTVIEYHRRINLQAGTKIGKRFIYSLNKCTKKFFDCTKYYSIIKS